MPLRLLVPLTIGKCVSASEDAGEREKNCVWAEGAMNSTTGAGAVQKTSTGEMYSSTGAGNTAGAGARYSTTGAGA